MAFRISCDLAAYEYRALSSGVSSKTNMPWLSLKLESPDDASQVEVGVPSELQPSVHSLGLRKGDVLNCRVLAVSSKDYSFIRLLDVPVVLSDSDDDITF